MSGSLSDAKKPRKGTKGVLRFPFSRQKPKKGNERCSQVPFLHQEPMKGNERCSQVPFLTPKARKRERKLFFGSLSYTKSPRKGTKAALRFPFLQQKIEKGNESCSQIPLLKIKSNTILDEYTIFIHHGTNF